MALITQIFAIIFYILLFSWVFFWIQNIILVKKCNCKTFYKDIQKNVKNKKLIRCLFKFCISLIAILVLYIVIGLIVAILVLFMMIITLGGAAFVDTGTGSNTYNFLMNFMYNYFRLFKYIGYYIYNYIYVFGKKYLYEYIKL